MKHEDFYKEHRGGTQDERLLETPHADEFLHTDTWRVFRIMGEFVQGFEDLAHITNGVAVFGSARTQPDDPEYRAAQETGALLARAGYSVITGGGPGIMEAANRGAKEAGGKSVGLNIALPFEQAPNRYITRDLVFNFHYFFMRKFWFAYLAKALVIFPGGFGTCDELFEILTLAQTDKLSKKIQVILYCRDYWEQVLDLKPMAEWGAIAEQDIELLEYADTPSDAFAQLQAHLIRHHLEPAHPQEEAAPGIAKTRG
jgi:uncharacterized protein (TIGR00730 family)